MARKIVNDINDNTNKIKLLRSQAKELSKQGFTDLAKDLRSKAKELAKESKSKESESEEPVRLYFSDGKCHIGTPRMHFRKVYAYKEQLKEALAELGIRPTWNKEDKVWSFEASLESTVAAERVASDFFPNRKLVNDKGESLGFLSESTYVAKTG